MDKDIIKALQAKVKAEHQFKLLIERELDLLDDMLDKHPEVKREWLQAMDNDSEHQRLERKGQDSYEALLQAMNTANIDINDDGTVVIR